MNLNATIRAFIRFGYTRELIDLIPNGVTGAARSSLIANIFRKRKRAVLAAWPA